MIPATNIRITVRNSDELEEIERFTTPGNTWYIINAQVLHGIEKITQNRRSVQIGFTDINPIVDLLTPIA